MLIASSVGLCLRTPAPVADPPVHRSIRAIPSAGPEIPPRPRPPTAPDDAGAPRPHGHPYHWEGQHDALQAERWIARGLGPASGVHIRNAGSMHILPGNCVKAPLAGCADYAERMRGMDHLAGFFVYVLLTVV